MLKENRWWLLIFLVVAILLASQIIITASHAQQQYITVKDANKHIREVQTVAWQLSALSCGCSTFVSLG
jgi:cell division protein FtsL